MDIVLTKEDLAGITVTQTGVHTLTKGGWDVRETTNTSELTPEQTARIIAAIKKLDDVSTTDSDEIHVSYIENGVLTNIICSQSGTSGALKEDLEGVLHSHTKAVDSVEITVTESDLDRVKLHNGLSVYEHPQDIKQMTGFTLEDTDGVKWKCNIPEYLRWPVYNYQLDQRGLAATLIAIRKLQSVPQGAIVQSVHLDTPGEETDKVSLLVGAQSLGVLHPVTAGQLIPYLTKLTQMMLPNIEVAPGGHTTKINIDETDLQRIVFREEPTTRSALTITSSTRLFKNLGFTLTTPDLRPETTYEPRNSKTWGEIYRTTYEDRAYALAALVAAKAVESGVASEIELNQYPMNYIAPGIASALRKRVDGKTPHQINEELNKLWETKTNGGN